MLPQEWEQNTVDPIEAYETLTRVAQEAEALGFTSGWLFDHFHSTTSPQVAQRAIFECWTSTAALARDTKHLRIGQMVTCNSFRHPALLAKMASTVDVLSHGRLDLGIGAGWYEQEYLAYGYTFPDVPIRLRQFREALHIIHAMWTEENVDFKGKYYQVHGAINQPKGVQKPHIPLIVAGKGEQVTLKIVARYGDACNFTHPTPEEMEQKFARIRHYCHEIGRDDHEISRTIYVNGFVGETDVEAITKALQISSKLSLDQIRLRGLVGNPNTIRRRLREIEQAGVQEVIVFIRDVAHGETLRLFAQSFD
jgi:F420-dependent oxidoreductase-like protein